MQIIKVTYYHDNGNKNPNRIRRKVLLDTDTPRYRNKSAAERINDAQEALDVMERWTDKQLTRICSFIT